MTNVPNLTRHFNIFYDILTCGNLNFDIATQRPFTYVDSKLKEPDAI
jgi:hypothetical protein